jgi:hypothetical protein
MSRELVITALQKHGLCNYFESGVCFDDEVRFGNIVALGDESEGLFTVTDTGRLISRELESSLPFTVKEKAYNCAIALLKQEQIKSENKVEIKEISTGYNVECTVSGGEVDLLSFAFYVPDYNQALHFKNTFLEDPAKFYSTFLALFTHDKEYLKDSFKELF